MTAELRNSIKKLRALSPKFNVAAEQAGETVKLVEKFLSDDCKAGITTTIRVWSKAANYQDDDQHEGMFLGYRRVSGRYRIIVQLNERQWSEELQRDEIVQSVTPWSDSSRGDKLESFPKLPALLESIACQMESGITAAGDTTTAVKSIIDALAEPSEDQIAVEGADLLSAMSEHDGSQPDGLINILTGEIMWAVDPEEGRSLATDIKTAKEWSRNWKKIKAEPGQWQPIPKFEYADFKRTNRDLRDISEDKWQEVLGEAKEKFSQEFLEDCNPRFVLK